jgi:hypothetical protein
MYMYVRHGRTDKNLCRCFGAPARRVFPDHLITCTLSPSARADRQEPLPMFGAPARRVSTDHLITQRHRLPLVFAQLAAVSHALRAVGMRGAAGALLMNFPPRPRGPGSLCVARTPLGFAERLAGEKWRAAGAQGGGCAAAALPPDAEQFCACFLLSAASTQSACSAWQAEPALTHRHPRKHARFGRCQRQKTRRCSPSFTESSPPSLSPGAHALRRSGAPAGPVRLPAPGRRRQLRSRRQLRRGVVAGGR